MQQAILERLRQSPGASEHELCWLVASDRSVEIRERLPTSYYSSFRRALSQLEARERIRIERRRFTSLPQVVRHYPWMTLSSDIRAMRQDLLPLLAAFAEAKGPRFPTVASERKSVLRDRRAEHHDRPEVPAERRAAWEELEEKVLRAALAQEDQKSRTLVVNLLMKGREYFVDPDVYALSRSMTELLGAAHRSSSASVRSVGAFVERTIGPWVDRESIAHNELKSLLVRVVSFLKRFPPSMDSEAVEFLLTSHRSVVEKHMPVPVPPKIRFGPPRTPSMPKLDTVLLRDVLRKVGFVTAVRVRQRGDRPAGRSQG